MTASDAAADRTWESLAEGDAFEEPYVITVEAYGAFLAASGDRSPLHVDDAYARERGFPERVVHGTMMNAFVSHFVGMRVPGRRALLHSVALDYLKPSHVGDRLVLQAKIAQKVDALRALVLHVHIRNETRGVVVARGRVQVSVAA